MLFKVVYKLKALKNRKEPAGCLKQGWHIHKSVCISGRIWVQPKVVLRVPWSFGKLDKPKHPIFALQLPVEVLTRNWPLHSLETHINNFLFCRNMLRASA